MSTDLPCVNVSMQCSALCQSSPCTCTRRLQGKRAHHSLLFCVAFDKGAGTDLSGGRLRYEQSFNLAADSTFSRTHMVPVYLGNAGWIMHFHNRAAACDHLAKTQMFWFDAATERQGSCNRRLKQYLLFNMHLLLLREGRYFFALPATRLGRAEQCGKSSQGSYRQQTAASCDADVQTYHIGLTVAERCRR